jgi:hypothetical protein
MISMVGDTTATSSTTALANVSAMTLTLSNGKTYMFDCLLQYSIGNNVTNTTQGLGLGLTFPAATIVGFQVMINGFSASAAFVGGIAASGGSVVSTAVSAGGGQANKYIATIRGIIKPSADGNIVLQYRAELSTTSGPIIHPGAVMGVWEMV